MNLLCNTVPHCQWITWNKSSCQYRGSNHFNIKKNYETKVSGYPTLEPPLQSVILLTLFGNWGVKLKKQALSDLKLNGDTLQNVSTPTDLSEYVQILQEKTE
jgi:hypothetical protein